MTVAADQLSRWEYTGDAATTEFAYTSKIYASSDLDVYVNGVLQSSGYSVTAVGNDAGGSVVFATAPADAIEIIIIRAVPNSQTTSLPLGGPLPSTSLELMVDRLQIQVQQLEAKLERALRYPDTDVGLTPAALPAKAARASQFLSFDSLGNATITAEVDLGDALTTSDPITWTGLQTFQGDNAIEVVDINPGAAEYGPIFKLYADRSVVATNDLICRIDFEGNNLSGTRQRYASINSSVHDAAANDGQMDIAVRIAGTLVNGYRFDSSEDIPRAGAFWTDGGTSEGPHGTSYRKAIPAANQPIGAYVFVAQDSNGVGLNYAKIRCWVTSPTAGAEISRLEFNVRNSGVDMKVLTIRPDGLYLDDLGVRILAGTGSPEGVVTAPVGSTFHRSDGGANTSLYVKESGTGNTGWVAK